MFFFHCVTSFGHLWASFKIRFMLFEECLDHMDVHFSSSSSDILLFVRRARTFMF